LSHIDIWDLSTVWDIALKPGLRKFHYKGNRRHHPHQISAKLNKNVDVGVCSLAIGVIKLQIVKLKAAWLTDWFIHKCKKKVSVFRFGLNNTWVTRGDNTHWESCGGEEWYVFLNYSFVNFAVFSSLLCKWYMVYKNKIERDLMALR
jgi:hypothetical protein